VPEACTGQADALNRCTIASHRVTISEGSEASCSDLSFSLGSSNFTRKLSATNNPILPHVKE
jgi:hypothetical protein